MTAWLWTKWHSTVVCAFGAHRICPVFHIGDCECDCHYRDLTRTVIVGGGPRC